MGNLALFIRKDWIVLRKYAWFFLLWLLFFSFGNNGNVLSVMLPAMIIILISNIDLNPFHKYTFSLPVSRREMILGKYMSSVFFMLVGLASTYLFQTAFSLLTGREMNYTWFQICVSAISLALFVTLYYPLYYWLGPKGGYLLKIVVMLVAFAVTFTLNNIIQNSQGWITSTLSDSGMVIMMGIGISGLLLVLSYFLAAAIFRRADV